MNHRPDELGLLTLNIGSPSAKRAERQLAWLAAREEDIFVLTEMCPTTGSEIIASRLANAGWQVHHSVPPEGERGVLIAARVPTSQARWNGVPYLASRAEGLTIPNVELDIFGVYVPSRDETPTKVARKERFATELRGALHARGTRRAVLLGDLNVLEPDHHPRYHVFRDWEYELYTTLAASGWVDAYRLMRRGPIEHSWVGPDERGFRFDHVFVTGDLRDTVRSCTMVHETREQRLTDHSAMTLSLRCAPVDRLTVDESLSDEPMALFSTNGE